MPETEQQDRTLSEVVVKEAVGKGLDSPLRDSILEAVEESEGGSSSRLPLAGAVFGLGAALGYLAGRESENLDLSGRSLEELEGLEGIEGVSIEEPEIVENVMEGDGETEAEAETDEGEAESAEAEDGSSTLSRLVLALAVLGGVALLRRRLSGGEEEEWEPIEEFEPATDLGSDEEEEEAESEEETESEEEEEMTNEGDEAESDEAEE